MPPCADIGSAVAGVVRRYALDPAPAKPGAGGATMCFFMKDGKTGADDFAVAMGVSDKSADELSRTQEYLAKSKPEQLVESSAATRLGGFISDPLGTGDLALAMPGVLVSVHTGGGEQMTRQQMTEVLVAVGKVIAG
ncbi:hypothetical protein LCL87_01325 [Rhodococcus hoagii]|nr:hypothetical protein [Prescottella equi]